MRHWRLASGSTRLSSGVHTRRLSSGGRTRRLATMAAVAGAGPFGGVSVLPAAEVARLPQRWVIFSDLHVRQETLPHCLELLQTVAAEARKLRAGIICLGDFWHAGAVLSTRQLNAVLGEMESWTDLRVLMIPGNHDQVMRGNPDPQLHALTPLQLAMPERISVFSRPTLVADSLWIPYGIDEAGVRNACDEAAALCAAAEPGRPLAAVFCHADVIGGKKLSCIIAACVAASHSCTRSKKHPLSFIVAALVVNKHPLSCIVAAFVAPSPSCTRPSSHADVIGGKKHPALLYWCSS